MNCSDFGHQFKEDTCPNFDAPFDFSHVSVIHERQQTNNVLKKKAPIIKRLLRLLYILSFAVFLITAASCGSGADYRPTQSPAVETAAPSASGELSVSIEEQVLLDQQGIKITAQSLTHEEQSGLSIKVLIENSTSITKTVIVSSASVNGVMVDPVFICDVGAGEEANSDILFRDADLSDAGIQSIIEIDLQFEIFGDENSVKSNIISITTTAPESITQTIDNNGTVVLDRDGIKVVALGLEKEDQSAGDNIYYCYNLNLYIENNSDYSVSVVPDEIYINNFMINSFMHCAVLPGKVAFDKICFSKDELEYSNITSIDNLEFRLVVSDADTYKKLFESEIISLTFPD